MKLKLGLLLSLLLVSCQPSYADLYDNTEIYLLHTEFANTTIERVRFNLNQSC